jgi:hypothetical protein
MDRKVVDGIADLDPTTQRAVAIWLARRACGVAGLTDLDWVKTVFAAVERGESLPFDLPEAFRLLRSATPARFTTVTARLTAHAPTAAHPLIPARSYDGQLENVSQQHMAVPTLWSAAADDPLKAALESLWHAIATFGIDYRSLLSEMRAAFPGLAKTSFWRWLLSKWAKPSRRPIGLHAMTPSLGVPLLAIASRCSRKRAACSSE